jgi:hypothetical protein
LTLGVLSRSTALSATGAKGVDPISSCSIGVASFDDDEEEEDESLPARDGHEDVEVLEVAPTEEEAVVAGCSEAE